MRTRRLLGASLTTVLAAGLVGASTPSATAGDNDASAWRGKRVAQTPGSVDGAVHVLTNRAKMVTVVRELGAGTDKWLIRESRDGGLGFTVPLIVPGQVQWFRYDESQRHDSTYAAYEADGRLWAAEASGGDVLLGPSPDQDADGSGLGPAGSEPPKVVAGQNSPDDALVTQDGTWYQHFGPVGGADPQNTPNDGGPASLWKSYPDPDVDGVPGNAREDYAFTGSGSLLVFWNDPSGALRVAQRGDARNIAAPFGPARTVAGGGEKYVAWAESSRGSYLVTQSPNGAVSLWTYRSGAGDDVLLENRTRLGGPVTSGARVKKPTVLVDARGTLTIGWTEPGVKGGGLVLWQQNRPGSMFLERPTLVPGTRGADVRVAASPRGNLTVALRRTSERATVRVKHLPIGKTTWSNEVRLTSPRPITGSSAAWAIGSPALDGDVRVAVNDTEGVYGFRFDAPRPVTKMTKPGRTTQRTTTYRIGWNTSWVLANTWQVRMREDKGRTYGAWRAVSVAKGQTSKTVTRPRGKTFCYQAKGYFGTREVTGWSAQRCVTVRR